MKMFRILVEKASIPASHDTKVIDIVKDVVNPVSVYWAANFVVCPNIGNSNDIIHVESAWFACYHVRQCVGWTHGNAVV